MQFQVPQYIEIEDKVFGSFTLKQFIYVVGALGIIYMIWQKIPIYGALPLTLIVGGLSGSLAFMDQSTFGKPFSEILESAFSYYKGEKLYVWKRVQKKRPQKEALAKTKNEIQPLMPNVSESKLKDLSWGLEVKSEDSDSNED